MQKRDVNAAGRVEVALKLRAQKIGYEEIARRAGYANAGTAYKAIMRELERRVSSNVDHLRREENELLDALHARVWPLAHPDDPAAKPNLFAVDRLIAISEARRKLNGLDSKADGGAIAAEIVIRRYDADVEAV